MNYTNKDILQNYNHSLILLFVAICLVFVIGVVNSHEIKKLQSMVNEIDKKKTNLVDTYGVKY
ncbi:MAG: hypothetical protein EOP34_03440 [Rickettsiales bacterium]|nr:MAG: hypothetical protein EOP34_03440 [Rickettsiales bacterium]